MLLKSWGADVIGPAATTVDADGRGYSLLALNSRVTSLAKIVAG
jgi:hypothetical protein